MHGFIKVCPADYCTFNSFAWATSKKSHFSSRLCVNHIFVM